jgi:spore germination cell wall hydrolase CwlJ-like protein
MTRFADVAHQRASMAAANEAEALDTLARTIWAEARGEGREGMEAVASVILNRVKHPKWWGRDIVSVCKKPFQFSCWNANDPNLAKLLSVTEKDAAFRLALEIARDAMAGKIMDTTGGATSYHTTAILPGWAKAMQLSATIGNHMFYTEA